MDKLESHIFVEYCATAEPKNRQLECLHNLMYVNAFAKALRNLPERSTAFANLEHQQLLIGALLKVQNPYMQILANGRNQTSKLDSSSVSQYINQQLLKCGQTVYATRASESNLTLQQIKLDNQHHPNVHKLYTGKDNYVTSPSAMVFIDLPIMVRQLIWAIMRQLVESGIFHMWQRTMDEVRLSSLARETRSSTGSVGGKGEQESGPIKLSLETNVVGMFYVYAGLCAIDLLVFLMEIRHTLWQGALKAWAWAGLVLARLKRTLLLY